MALVDYSDSESESGNSSTRLANLSEEIRPRKRALDNASDLCTPRSRLPPLPATFHSLYATNVRASTADDPALHDGRKRQVPHSVGNWPTHVFLEWVPSNAQIELLSEIVSDTRSCLRQRHPQNQSEETQQVHPFFKSALEARLPLHISLSTPLTLTTEFKDGFLDRMCHALLQVKVNPKFRVEPMALKWVSNFDRTRRFLVLSLRRPEHDELNLLLEACNRVCLDFGLPLLYESSERLGVPQNCSSYTPLSADKVSSSMQDHSEAFHISIAWTLADISTHATQSVPEVDLSRFQQHPICFGTVKVKIGNQVYDVDLARAPRVFM